jgi:hypothetical protein
VESQTDWARLDAMTEERVASISHIDGPHVADHATTGLARARHQGYTYVNNPSESAYPVGLAAASEASLRLWSSSP